MSEGTPLRLDDQLWEQLNAVTDGAANACYQCGTCTATCPWPELSQVNLSVRYHLRRAHLGLTTGGEGLWRCTACKECEAGCPREVPIVDVLRGLRGLDLHNRQAPSVLVDSLWSIYENYNPYGQPRLERHAWAKGLDVPILDAGETIPVLYYVGCAASYDRRLQALPRAVARLLNASGIEWATLGPHERHDGDLIASTGDDAFFDWYAQRNISLLEATGAKVIVATSPHTVEALKRYPWKKRPEIMHYTKFLKIQVDDKKLEFKTGGGPLVTYHDPCYLGRWNQDYDAPRELLAAAGLQLREMEHTRGDALCCGGGGGRIFQDSLPGERFSEPRMAEAATTGAEVMVTTCPFCIQNFEDSGRTHAPDMQVRDLAEILAEALPLGEA
ncbi:MAG: (Fe-S)-binding protein [Candidatus Poseidoniia archaeon]|nr:(Fe-S)-binding protein [Candidatus Poseidoniia archaeon]MDP6834757.1 (Fe-S)-binding protein [Candidatus Poseidoniia archaeon]